MRHRFHNDVSHEGRVKIWTLWEQATKYLLGGHSIIIRRIVLNTETSSLQGAVMEKNMQLNSTSLTQMMNKNNEY